MQELGQVVSVPSHRNGAHEGLPPLPVGSAVQLPGVALWLQDSHAVAHELLQHTPWAQKPVLQSPLRVQAPPFDSLGTHWKDALQKSPATHWLSAAQLGGQAGLTPLQTNGEQAGVPAFPSGRVVHVPFALAP